MNKLRPVDDNCCGLYSGVLQSFVTTTETAVAGTWRSSLKLSRQTSWSSALGECCCSACFFEAPFHIDKTAHLNYVSWSALFGFQVVGPGLVLTTFECSN